ncbi:MAG: hypothetical protein AAB320_03870 [Elusimicrobiota bacterium]
MNLGKIGFIAALSVASLVGPRSSAAAAKDKADMVLVDPQIVMRTKDSVEYFDFRTTKLVWKTMSSGPDAMKHMGPLPGLLFPIVGVANLVASVVTVPVDLIRAPFRKHRTFKRTTWVVSGRLTDGSGRPKKGVDVEVAIDRTDSFLDAKLVKAAEGAGVTEHDGRFTATLSGRMESGERLGLTMMANDEFLLERHLTVR